MTSIPSLEARGRSDLSYRTRDRSRTPVREILYSPIVSVSLKVGDNLETFQLHRDLLCRESLYFRKAFNGSFRESEIKSSTLQDVRTDDFRIFAAWLYSGRLCFVPQTEGQEMSDESKGKDEAEDEKALSATIEIPLFAEWANSAATMSPVKPAASDLNGPLRLPVVVQPGIDIVTTPQDQSDPIKEDEEPERNISDRPITWTWRMLVNLYILGDRLDVPQFRIDVIDIMGERLFESLPFLPDVEHAFDNLPKSSPLLTFLIHAFAHYEIFAQEPEAYESLPPEFLVGIIRTNAQRLPRSLCTACYKDAVALVENYDIDVGFVSKEEDGAPMHQDICHYHEHRNDEERAMCQRRRVAISTSD